MNIKNAYTALIGFLIGAIIASACWGQQICFDRSVKASAFPAFHLLPLQHKEFWQGSVPTSIVVEPLQTLIDDAAARNKIADLGGQTYDALSIIFQTKHSGLIVQNGTINCLPGAKVGNVKTIQGATWQGNTYPAGEIDLTFRNVRFVSGFNVNEGLQARNEALADAAGYGANLFTTTTYRAGFISFEDCSFECAGNSAIAGQFLKLNIRNCRFHRVAKHCIGLREWGGTVATIDGMTCTECGNWCDLHGEPGRLATSDKADIRNIVTFDSTGRAKNSGGNWEVDAANWTSIQSSVVNLNMYSAWSFSRNLRRFHLNGFVIVNYPSMGISSNSDPGTTPGDIQLTNIHVRNSMSGIAVQQQLSVVDSEFDGIHHRYRTAAPIWQANNYDSSVKSDLAWAQTYDQIELLFAAKRAEWGTTYPASGSYWIPKTVFNLMESR